MNRPTHDDDLVLTFDATQEARHAAVLRLNEMARAMVERAKANAAGQQPEPLRLLLSFCWLLRGSCQGLHCRKSAAQ